MSLTQTHTFVNLASQLQGHAFTACGHEGRSSGSPGGPVTGWPSTGATSPWGCCVSTGMYFREAGQDLFLPWPRTSHLKQCPLVRGHDLSAAFVLKVSLLYEILVVDRGHVGDAVLSLTSRLPRIALCVIGRMNAGVWPSGNQRGRVRKSRLLLPRGTEGRPT